MRAFCGWQSWTAIIIGWRQVGPGRQAGKHERRGNYSKKLLTLRVESFVTLSWSTAGSARRRWGGAWGRCAWWGWGGDYLEVVHRAHCHRLRVEANQSNRSLTPQPQYQLQVDWDGKSPTTASHRWGKRNKAKLTKVDFWCRGSHFRVGCGRGGRGEAVSKTFPKAFQNIPSPRQQLFSFNLQTSAWSTWLSCYCQIIQTFPISPVPPGSMITKAFWQIYWYFSLSTFGKHMDIFSLSTSAIWIF